MLKFSTLKMISLNTIELKMQIIITSTEMHFSI